MFTLEPRGSGLHLVVERGVLKVGTASPTGNNAWRQTGSRGGIFALYNVDGRMYVLADGAGNLVLASWDRPAWRILGAPEATPAPTPEPVSAVRWKSGRDATYLHSHFGTPEASNIDPAWKATAWVVRRVDRNAFCLENAGNGKFLVVQNGRLALGERDLTPGTGNDVWAIERQVSTKDGRAETIQLKHQQTRQYLTLGPANPGAQFGRRSVMLVPAPDANSSWLEEEVVITEAARPPAEQPSIVRSASDVLGTYRYEPYSNQWHQGTIEASGPNTFIWRNQAGVSWALTPGGAAPFGVLNTDAGCPYWNSPGGKTFEIQRDASGKVIGFRFQGELYRRQ